MAHVPPRKASAAAAVGYLLRLATIRLAALGVCAASLGTSMVLLVRYHVLGGPGDQLTYYEQASQLSPFVNPYYGPGYFVAIRIVHDLSHFEWFLVGKITSWLSACVFLLLCYRFLQKVLEPPSSWLALMLVAMNPTFVTQSYAPDTIMYAASWALAGIVLATSAGADNRTRWLAAGIVLGIACLTRFQTVALALGAVGGILVAPSMPLVARVKSAGLLFIGMATPLVAWRAGLLWHQGYVPENHNFVHLTMALGQFRSWSEVPELVSRYGSFWGVLFSSPTASLQIAAYAIKQAIKVPFDLGFRLLFIAAGWLVPGVVVLFLSRREVWGPWLGAFATGLVLTGIGSRGWRHYYLVFIPFFAISVSRAIWALGRSGVPSLATASWCVILLTTVLWSPSVIAYDFRNANWEELATARQHLEASAEPNILVTSTARSFRYGTSVPFVAQQTLMRPGEAHRLVERLREAGVTHLLVTERHTPHYFPDLAYLLADKVPNLPAGLSRELLIVSPRRLAIYRVLSP